LQSIWNVISIELVAVLITLGTSMGLALALGSRSRRRLVRELEDRLAQSQLGGRELRVAFDRADTALAEAKRALSEIPEIAQRLSATRNLRDIPDCALDLIQEIFDPSYALFYRCTQGAMLAVSARGSRASCVGERLKAGEGLPGFAALKQLPVTPDEAELDPALSSRGARQHGVPEEGFSVCLPIVRGNRTLGVMLVGPCRRNRGQLVDLGKMIALMTSVAITSTVVLKEQELLAQTDGLTGLLNKSRILHHAKEAIRESGPRQRVSVFLFDIDHFKQFNDTNGHLPGDDLLRSLGDLLKGCVREGEYVGRYGGEEFLLVLCGVEKYEALRAAERVRRTIAEHPFRHAERQPLGRISISGGVATWPEDGHDAETIVRCADEALYQAKHGGRDRVLPYRMRELGASHEFDLLGAVEADPLPEEAKDPPPRD
jgi:diguanylate cyclase (GGDEF)-like protein